MRRLSTAFCLIVLLTGCSANWHLNRAIQKNPAILQDGVVMETRVDSVPFFVPDTTVELTIDIPSHTDSAVVSLPVLLSSGFVLENDRHLIEIRLIEGTDILSIKATAKGFNYPARVKVAGRWYNVPFSYDQTVIRPRVRHGLPWWSLLIALIVGGFLIALLRK